MGMFDRFIKNEECALENPSATVSLDDFLHIMGWEISHLMVLLWPI